MATLTRFGHRSVTLAAAPIHRLQRKYPHERLKPATGRGIFEGIFVQTDDQTGLATHIEALICR